MTPSIVQNMLDIYPALYFVVDDSGKLVHVSKGVLSLLGYQPDELEGRPITELIAEEDHSPTQQALAKVQAGHHIRGFVNHYRHKRGHLVPISWYSVIDSDTRHIHGIGQKTAEPMQLKEVDYESIDLEGQLYLNNELRITHINEAGLELSGRRAEDLLNRKIWDCFPEVKENLFEAEYQKALEQHLPVRFKLFCPSLQHQWFEVNAFPFNTGLTVFFRNIDAEKKAQEELWKLSLIARETNNIVMVTDDHGYITWVNDAFTRITGYSFEEASGQLMESFLIGPETEMATVLAIQEAIQNGTPYHAELLQYAKSGRKIWTEVQGQPVKDHKGRIQQFFSIGTDITERKLFEERLEKEQQQRQRTITRATIEAQERERSMVSQELHDNVNQVLTTVKLYTELCISGIGQQEELLRKSVQLLQDSINEIRSLSKRLSAPTLGKVRLRDSVRELTENIIATNRLKVETELSTLEEVDIPQDLHLGIYRILQEHFTNILKHSSANSVQVSFDVVNEELVLKVRDNGKGFNTKELKNGIGIANMLSRAESLKGTLTLNSAPGLGCVLLVRFPLAA